MPNLHSLAPTQPIVLQDWLYPNLLPESELVLLDGAPGVGKSLICSVIASGLSIRFEEEPNCKVLVLASPEQRDLFIEFLSRHEPEYKQIQGIDFDSGSHDAETSLVQPLLNCIEASLSEHRPSLLIIDSLEELLRLGSEPTPQELADLWRTLRTMAQTHECTLLVPRKNGLHESRAYGPFTRLGSEIARYALTLHWHPTDPAMRIITIARNQRGPVGEQTNARIRYDGIVRFTYTDIHEHVRPARSPATWQPDPDHQLENNRIVEIVEELIKDKPVPGGELKNQLKQQGFSERAVDRALRKAKLRTIRVGTEQCYVPSEKMILRYLSKQRQAAVQQPKEVNTLENQARTAGAPPCTLSAPSKPQSLRQTG